MRRFAYHEPTSLAEAGALLRQYGDSARPIAGGQSLLVMMCNQLVNPEHLVDLKGIRGLDGISFDPQSGLTIGATTTIRAIETSSVVAEHYPLLRETARHVATVPVRNLGTIGGNLAHAEMGSDPPQTLIALDAKVIVVGPDGERAIGVEQLITGYFETLLRPGELIAAVRLPLPAPHSGWAYYKHRVRAMDLAVVAVAAVVTMRNGACGDARIGLGGVAPTPLRASAAEDSIRGGELDAGSIARAAEAAAQATDPISDIHGSADYRRELVGVYVRRALAQAAERARAA
jgi:aerobic carbon-monoxide dehydrogenase medium subunit